MDGDDPKVCRRVPITRLVNEPAGATTIDEVKDSLIITKEVGHELPEWSDWSHLSV